MRRPEAYHAALRELSRAKRRRQTQFDPRSKANEGRRPRTLAAITTAGPAIFPGAAFPAPRKTIRIACTVQSRRGPGIAGGTLSRHRIIFGAGEHRFGRKPRLAGGEEHFPSFTRRRLRSHLRRRRCDATLQAPRRYKSDSKTVVNFLAPSAPDRYFESDGQRFPLRWAASIPSDLRVVDEWQESSRARGARGIAVLIAPIETVSEAEDGFERIYQGSQIIAIWPVELAPGGEWNWTGLEVEAPETALLQISSGQCFDKFPMQGGTNGGFERIIRSSGLSVCKTPVKMTPDSTGSEMRHMPPRLSGSRRHSRDAD